MKRVLIVVWSDLNNSGGVQNGIRHMTSMMKDEFIFDVVTFFPVDKNNLGAYEVFNQIHYISCDRNSKAGKFFEYIFRPQRLYRGAKRILSKTKYDAVHCHDLQLGAYFLKAANDAGVPIRICHSHNPDAVKKNDYFRKMYCAVLRPVVNKYANVKFGCSKQACDYMFGKNREDTFVVNNELVLKDFDTMKYPREKDSHIRFVHVGRFTYQKNHEFVINTFRLIHQHFANSILTLVGWGELEQSVREQISEYGIQDSVVFLPHTSNISEVFSKSDYMIFPSRYEGLGRVLIEAQAMEVMCFASDVIPRETELGLCVYYSLSDGYEAWAEKIIRFIEGNEREGKCVNRELLRAFDINEVAKEHAKIYRGETLIGIR